MRQQLADAAGRLSRQSRQHILEVGVRVVPVEAGRLHETHDGRGALSGTQAAGKEPVLALIAMFR